MNAPLRRVAVACLVLFGALFLNVNYIQAIDAGRLRNNRLNKKVELERFDHPRGAILVGDVAVAESVKGNRKYQFVRHYPAGARYATVTGYFPVNGASTGIEQVEDPVLDGSDSRFFTRRLADIIFDRRREGGIVRLTLDARAQQVATDLMAGHRGAVVALEPSTGRVLALVTNPTFDPNPLAAPDDTQASAAIRALLARDDQPLLDRAISRTYPPGSTFKVVTAAAALGTGQFTPDSMVASPRQLHLPLTAKDQFLQNFGGESCGGDQITLLRALQISCNTAFAGVGLSLGQDVLRAQAERFGLNTTPGIELDAAKSRFPDSLNEPQTAQSAIGQYDVRVTPLQMAMIAAGVANRGTVMTPFVVDSLLTPSLEVVSQTKPHAIPGQPAMSQQNASALTTMMIAVVNGGTGSRAALPGVQVAGKTGTAQHGEGAAPHAWFIGFAPADQPRVAVAVLVEDGGNLGSEATGGRLAAPIARAVMAAVLGG